MVSSVLSSFMGFCLTLGIIFTLLSMLSDGDIRRLSTPEETSSDIIGIVGLSCLTISLMYYITFGYTLQD